MIFYIWQQFVLSGRQGIDLQKFFIYWLYVKAESITLKICFHFHLCFVEYIKSWHSIYSTTKLFSLQNVWKVFNGCVNFFCTNQSMLTWQMFIWYFIRETAIAGTCILFTAHVNNIKLSLSPRSILFSLLISVISFFFS